MKGMSRMQDLNTAHVLRKLWEKLPRYLRSKWTERNSKTKTTKGRMANFEEFSQLVCEQAELATDPIFSEEGVSKVSLEDKGNYNGKARLPKGRFPLRKISIGSDRIGLFFILYYPHC